MIRRRNPRFYQGEWKDILTLLFSGKVTKGEYINLFEKRFAQYIGTKFAIATSSGRSGLEMLLGTLELKEGDEVIVPAYTLKDLIYLIKAKGIVPKLVDIERSSFNINPDLVESKITKNTRVIIATHLFGLPCNMEKILDIAKKYNLRVIEDCAHALGAQFKDKKVGSLGNAAFFSFEVLKSINTFGGGMITTDDEEMARKVRQRLKQYPFGAQRILNKILFTYIEYLIIKSPLYPLLMSLFIYKTTAKMISKMYLFLHRKTRINYLRFSNLQAILGLRQLDSLDESNKKRDGIAMQIEKKLPKNILLQKSGCTENRIFYFFITKIPSNKNIEKIKKEFIKYRVDVGIKDEITDNCADILKESNDYPITREIFNSNLQLPMYDGLKKREVIIIASALNKIFSSAC